MLVNRARIVHQCFHSVLRESSAERVARIYSDDIQVVRVYATRRIARTDEPDRFDGATIQRRDRAPPLNPLIEMDKLDRQKRRLEGIESTVAPAATERVVLTR